MAQRGPGELMRRFAWVCVVIGVLGALAWPLYVSTVRERTGARAAAAMERMNTDGPGIPGGPWELERRAALRAGREAQDLSIPIGMAAGGWGAGFGVLLLRRSEARM